MTKLRLILPFLTLLLAAPFAARADDLRPFCADRPGKATPPCILDAGHVQIETALADAVFNHHGDTHEDIYSIASTEIRFGLTKRLEAEAAWAPVIIDRVKGQGQVTGSGDATFGMRFSLTDPDKDGPQVSAQGFVNAPTATHHLGQGGWSGGFRMPMTAPLAGGFTIGASPEVDVVRNASGHGTHSAVNGAVSLSRGFGDNTFGVELWGLADNDPAGHSHQATFDLTFARLIGKAKANQLDAGVNLGLNNATPGVEAYVGFSHRF
jgi:hypothetical protein